MFHNRTFSNKVGKSSVETYDGHRQQTAVGQELLVADQAADDESVQIAVPGW
ncbi:MAG: hypothetical protein GY807_04195 [Gammaproteobacteria bacterium]|nr:hypothetical protein [Gammaproteobacteria bacterium]